MNIFRNKDLYDFVYSSYLRMKDYQHSGRYFHTLKKVDSSPTVVHHKTDQLTIVIEGSGVVILNGVKNYICSQDMIIIPAGTCHAFIADEKDLLLFHIHIPDEGRDLDRTVLNGTDYNRYEVIK